MNLPSLRFFAFFFACLLSAASFLAAEEKTYNVSGPVIAVDANTITLTQGKGREKYVIRRDASTQAGGNVKPGDIVHVEYFMTATGISPKGGAKIGVTGVKTYKVGGPVLAMDANSISLTQGKGTEKYVISRNASTQTSGNPKTGDQVRVDYYMTATTIGPKAAGQPATIGAPVEAPVPVAPVTPRVVPGPPRPLVQPPATAPRHTMPAGTSATGAAAPTSTETTVTTPVATPPAEAAAPVKKSRKSKKEKATATASAPASAGSPAATDATPTASPTKKARKTKKEQAAAASTKSSADASATPGATPAKKSKKSTKAKTGDDAVATPTPTPAKP
jgi:hypothetical protein